MNEFELSQKFANNILNNVVLIILVTKTMVIMTRVKHKFLLNAILILNANSITTNYIITTTFTSLQISPSPSPVSPPLLPILASTYLWAAMISGGQAKFSRGMSANLDFYCDQYDFIIWMGWQHCSSKWLCWSQWSMMMIMMKENFY